MRRARIHFQSHAFAIVAGFNNVFLKNLLCIISLIASTCLYAQDEHELDSLKQSLITAKNDTNKVDTYESLGYYYQWSNPDSALAYAIPGLALAKELGYVKGEYNLILPLAEALALKGNYAKALTFRYRAMELADRLKDSVKIANSLALTGNVYFYSKNYSKALEYLYKAKATNLVSIGGDQFINCFIGQTYFHSGNMDSALLYIQRAYEIDVKEPTYHWVVPYQYLAALYEQKGNLTKALDLYKQSTDIAYENSDKFRNYNGFASVYNKMGNKDSAIFYAKQAITEGTSLSIMSPVIDASILLVDIYKSMHKTDSAFKYQEMLLVARDSLFSQEKVKQMQNVAFDDKIRQQEIATEQDKYRNKIKMYSLLGVLVLFITIGIALWRNNRSKQKANALLNNKNKEIANALQELKATQAQLVQREKMASLGELTAGIAHEIQNPLNFVNNFSEVNRELITELVDEVDKDNKEEVKTLAASIKQNLEKISHHGKRADAIVKGMLQHSHASTAPKEATHINKLAVDYVRLAYHGNQAKQPAKPFVVRLDTNVDTSIGEINVVAQDIGSVILNLMNNAFYAVNEKATGFKIQSAPDGYEPKVIVCTKNLGDRIEIRVKDNGNGIPQKIKDKIFQPFFTTKPTGQGTGLGLSLSYDIVKAHGGEIRLETKDGEGSEFIVSLPI